MNMKNSLRPGGDPLSGSLSDLYNKFQLKNVPNNPKLVA